MPTCLTCLRLAFVFDVPLSFSCLRTSVALSFTYLRAYVVFYFTCLRAYVPLSSPCLRVYVSLSFHVQVPTCLGVSFYLTCLPALVFYVPSCIRVIVFCVPPSLCVLFSCPKVKKCFTFAVNAQKLSEFHLNEFNKNFPIWQFSHVSLKIQM